MTLCREVRFGIAVNRVLRSWIRSWILVPEDMSVAFRHDLIGLNCVLDTFLYMSPVGKRLTDWHFHLRFSVRVAESLTIISHLVVMIAK